MTKANILIIEDNTIQAMYLQQVLNTLDVNVIGCVTNADDAFLLASKNKIDIVISDINIIGEKDGIEVSRVIQHEQGSQIIFLTAFKDQETLLRASNVDFSGYLLKPFREDELIVLVNLIINKYHLNTKAKLVQINEHHSYDKTKGLLYLNEKEMYLTRNENTLFNTLFASINMPIAYNDFSFESDKRKVITNNLNVKLKGLVVRDLKEENSLLLTFK